MPLDLSLTGRSVLLTGIAPDTIATVHALLRDGAHVTVAAPDDPADLPTSVRDLAERGLVALRAEPEHTAYDVVIRSATPTPPPGRSGAGEVVLVGGGPSDAGLLTVAGLDAIRRADVVVHDRLAPLAALVHARAGTEIIDVGKIPRGEFTPQERINAILLEHARRGRVVVRLKGGDGFVFGRGGEEAQACRAAGIPVTVVPGITSSIAGPALAGIPVTHRDLVQGFSVVSGHVPPGDPRSTVDWGALARSGTTLVVLMGVATLPAITAELVAQGLAGDTPAAVVADAGMSSMRTVRAPLDSIAETASREGITAPAVAVVGAVAALDVLA
ncbi:uroporphyrinogen-III C-methyltransferase [Intrasporangium calvum]|uniref:uroporphyrinogen-III C-methyltransferase n=1 Tax=Intrasporangium calvum (strain ATCC 23552 / DSM 43043 / JCM 3097 / NBRC 12989 / NCIMB 10167 / NRRL B-3866 / 7 KIP) TaxID=710696 RepID=E6SBK3_INTC7|nr:uroporphyrinogen-III C-methyltransferase [Intrasporangium calvum]ADU47334.1 uroporphyrinogen-III C-methyltransferase [Intrasporangium calvum DSM 43043]